MVEYKDLTTRDKCIRDTHNEYLAFLYLNGADQSKYGSILRGLSSQFALGNDQYPKTLEDATDVLSNHRFDNEYMEKKKKLQKQPPSSSNAQATPAKKEEENVNLSFAQMEGRCYCCSKKGHMSNKCRFKDKPKSEWLMNKTPEITQAQHVM